MKNTITFRNTFTDCDDFASYVLDSLAGLGYEVTEELNTFLGVDLPIETDLYKIETLPNTGENYKKFESVRSWLYDLFEMKKKDNIINLFQNHIIKLAELNLIPLSSQLQRITGDSYNNSDFVNEYDKNLNSKSNTVIVHIKTGLKFLIP